MSNPLLDRLIIAPWPEIGKARLGAVLSDLNGLSGPDMLGDLWPHHSSVDEMREFLHSHRALALVHRATGHIYGGFGLREDEHSACCFYYYLFPAKRRLGLSQTLLSHVEAWAFRDKNCMTLRARCAASNTPSIKALTKAGFVAVQTSLALPPPPPTLLFIKTRPSIERV